MTLTPTEIRSKAKEIFETAFPPNGYATDESLKKFCDESLSPKATSWDCPLTGHESEKHISNPTPDTLFGWFKQHFDPSAMKYTEFPLGEIMVAGNVASFHKGFFIDLGNGCVHGNSVLIMELDDDGKLTKWIDHFDAASLEEQFAAAAKFND
mmetsp:Transcript_47538/g.115821  ORF Transcript_47538/g.115821 Transcript_47538/m.115821 type:complete len:153 (+) Transcript_47538:240-698(+)